MFPGLKIITVYATSITVTLQLYRSEQLSCIGHPGLKATDN